MGHVVLSRIPNVEESISRLTLQIIVASTVLLVVSAAIANGGPSTDASSRYNPTADAKAAVDGFLCAYRSGLDDSALMVRIGYVREWVITLREAGDLRLAEPLTEVVADTAAHSDAVTSLAMRALTQLRVQSALSAVRRYLELPSRPLSRLGAAAMLAILGEAELGIPVLEEYVRQHGASSEGHASATLTYAFLDNGRAVELRSPVQESIVASFFQRVAEGASGQTLVATVCYLLQKDELSRTVAFRVAERTLKKAATSPSDENAQHNIRAYLEMYGGERGRALLGECPWE
jgi:hypothetical protein